MSKKSNNSGEINERVRKLELWLQGVITLLGETDTNLGTAFNEASQILQGSEKMNIQDLATPIESSQKQCRTTQGKAEIAERALHSFKA